MKKALILLLLAASGVSSAAPYTLRMAVPGIKPAQATVAQGSSTGTSSSGTSTPAAPAAPVGLTMTGAFYGYGTTGCDVLTPLKKACDGKTTCQMVMSNSVCGDPYPNKVKTWWVDYSCKGVAQTRQTGSEGGTASFTCN